MTLRTIEHLSADYNAEVQLRIRVLLQPLGIPATYIQPHTESDDIHVGAFEGAVLIGCCVLTNRGNGAVQLRQMAVDRTLQGTGIGAAIVVFAEGVAKAAGFATLFMHARNPVIPFYQKSGYVISGHEFFEVGIGHHRMEKSLSA